MAKNSHFIAFCLLLSLLQTINCYTFNGFMIKDLEYSGTAFQAEANTWSVSGLEPGANKWTNCAGTYLLGGLGSLQTFCGLYTGSFTSCNQWGQWFSKTYTSLPQHSSVYFSVTFWALSTWDWGDYFDMYFGGLSFSIWTMSVGSFTETVCGGYGGVSNIRIYGIVSHSASTFTVTFTSRMDESSSNEAWGIRDLQLLFSTAANSNYKCASPSWIPSLPGGWPPCSCSGWGYTAASCASCASGCTSCFGSGPSQCYACASGYMWNGGSCLLCHPYCSVCFGTNNDQCSACNSGYYLWAGNTCIPSCSPPLVQTSSTSTNIQVPAISQTECTFPCTQGFYLDWNGNCQGACDYPLQATTQVTSQGPIYVCNYPCATTQYLYWDGLCENSCSTPVYNTVYNGRNLCKFPCTTAANPIAYWDGSCSNTCNFPLVYVIAHDKQFCTDPCTTPGYYLYNNGSCLATCQTYFTTGIIAGQLLCNYPCASNQYLYTNGSCLATCNPLFYNLTMLADKYCYYPCLPTEWLYNNGSCLPTCDWRFNTRNLVGEKYCDFPCLPRVYLYLNGTCQNYCRTYFNPWFDKKTNDYYCDNPCNTSIMLNNGTCRSTCDSRYISYSGGSDKFCDYPCAPSQYLYTNGSCLLRCDAYYYRSNYLGDKFCDNPCASGQYVSYNGSCKSTCTSPYIPQTFGTDLFCRSPCKAGDYLYSNNTCMSWCTPNFIASSYGADKFCNYPCSSGQFLYEDGTCKSTCQTYFVQALYGSDKFCNFPCAVDKYLYQNGSCLSTCNSLFVVTNFSGTAFQYCQRPCSVSTDFIYWDGTCKSTCSTPPLQQRTEGTNKFCEYPCDPSTEFLYWNGSCLSSCDFPLQSRTETDLKRYCDYPCTSLQSLRWDGECVNSCSYPMRIKSQSTSIEVRCLPPCDSPDQYFNQDTGICDTYCDPSSRISNSLYKVCSGTSQKTTGFINTLSTPPSDPRAISFITVHKSIQYMKYLDTSLPPRLQRLSQGKGNPPLSLNTAGLLIPEDAFPTTFTQHVLPVVFWKHGLTQGFLANFWNVFMVLGLLLVLGTIAYSCELLCIQAQWNDWQEIFERIRVIILWNLVIMTLATNFDYIILYSSLEFRTLSFDSPIQVVSFILCVITIIFAVILVLLACSLVFKIQSIKPAAKQSNNAYAKTLVYWQSFQVLYRGFRDNSLLSSLFYVIYLVRMSIPSFIASLLYITPLTQSCIYIGISIAIIWYLLHSDPLKKRINQIQLVLTELLIFTVNICLLILSISDNQEADNFDTRVFIGDIIILCNFGINIIGVVFLVIKLALGIRTAILSRKKSPQTAKAAWLQLIFLPFQQAAFGFEQVQVVRFQHEYSKLTSHKTLLNKGSLKTQVLKSDAYSPLSTLRSFGNDLASGYESNAQWEFELSQSSPAFPVKKIVTKDAVRKFS